MLLFTYMTDYNEKFDKAIDHFKHELSSLRVGRASTGLVDGVLVESYGQKVPISHIASVNIPDAKTIAIQPWDKANMAPIEKAILASNIGLNPVNDGVLIRLSIPPMTEERRKEMVKVVHQLEEQTRISIRAVREEIVKELKAQEDANEITSDDLADARDLLQTNVDTYNALIKEITANKEKEVMTI